MQGFLTCEQRQELTQELKLEKIARYADRSKVILLLDEGENFADIARFLFLHENTVRAYFKSYKNGGLDQLCDDNYSGKQCRLDEKQLEKLDEHLDEEIYLRVADIQAYIKISYDINYAQRGVRHLLKRLGFVYKKPKKVPGKADRAKQEQFLQELEHEKLTADEVYYFDGVHPQHNPQAACGWIKKGKIKELKTNTGRKRVNCNGGLNADTKDVVTVSDCKSVNAQTTIELIKKIEAKHPEATKIIAVADNARYYRCKLVNEYLENSIIEIKFLPPYSPNLNLIERLWRHMKKKVCYNQYYEKYDCFRQAVFDYFDNLENYKDELTTLLNPKFYLIGS